MRFILNPGESRDYPAQGRFLYIKEATGTVGVEITTADNRKSEYLLEKNDQVEFPARLQRVSVTNRHTLAQTVELVEGEGIFHPNQDGQKVTLTGQDLSIEVVTVPGTPLEIESTDAKPVKVVNKGGARLETSSADIGAMADAAATTDGGAFTLIALIKRLLGKLPAALGQTTMAASLPVTLASNQSAIPASQSGTWTVMPGNTANTTAWLTSLRPGTTGGMTRHKKFSAASTNATSVKATAGTLFRIQGHNLSGSDRFLKLYTKATAPTVGTDVPVETYVLKAGQPFSFSFGDIGAAVATGIAYAITGALADNDTTAIGADEIVMAIHYA